MFTYRIELDQVLIELYTSEVLVNFLVKLELNVIYLM